MKNKRREFLKTAGSSALFASLGSSFFISCGDDDDLLPITIDEFAETGYVKDGNLYIIDLNHSSFSTLTNEGSWKLFSEGAMLIVNVGSNVIRAFSNECPHASCRTNWQYSNENFTCTCHDSIFSNSGNFITGPANSDLTSYIASINENYLTIST